MIRRSARVAAVGAASVLGVACADEATCDEGQALIDGNCQCKPGYVAATQPGEVGCKLPPTRDAGGSGGAQGSDAGSDGALSAGDAGGGACEGQPAVDFGTRCTDDVNHGDCGCPADFCAIAPNESEGYCTRTGCKEDPTICPSGWTCFDLSGFDPTLPSLCRPPEN